MRLLPYGKMSEGYLEFVFEDPMNDWFPALPGEERKARLAEWREGMRNLVAENIWPWFDRSSNDWKGAAAGWAEAATEIEIKVMMEEFQADPPWIDKPISSPNVVDAPSSHLHHFLIDDDLAQPPAINLNEYDRTLSPSELKTAATVATSAYDTKINGLFWLKHQFVRPRAYQASMVFGLHDFKSLTARTALHSSCYSGHCLEGILFSCAVADAWWSGSSVPDKGRINSLKQYAVDFGDRRVFAGVHYPSDNISSWVIAMNLIPLVFGDASRILEFARDAIVNHSTVYKVVQRRYRQHAELKSAIDLLEQALSKSVS